MILRSLIGPKHTSKGLLPSITHTVRGTKSWAPMDDKNIQKLTEQALIHDISLHQMETVKQVVPWFLKAMPDSYFNQVSEEMRRSHLQAVAAIHDLRQSDLSLKIMNKEPDGKIHVTILSTHTRSGSFLGQLEQLMQSPMPQHDLANIKVFSSEDGQFALNIFTFEPKASEIPTATMDDAKHIMQAIEEVKAGKHDDNPRVPKYDENLFSEASMKEYVAKCSPQYVQSSHPRRFMIQRALYEQVKGTDDSAVHIEKYHGTGGPPSGTAAWVTLAAGNVFPDELLKLTADMLAMRGMDIWRAHMDNVYDPGNSIPADQNSAYSPGYTTQLRLLVSPDPSVSTSPDSIFGPDFVPRFTRDLKRCKWLDDMTLRLAFQKDAPHKKQFGASKAEVVTALCSMMHSPLSKQYPIAFASTQSIVDTVTSSPYLAEQAEAIAQLFLDRFNPAIVSIDKEAADVDFEKRSAAIQSRLARLQREEARFALQKMLDAVKYTLKTNFYNDDRYALSLRVDPAVMFSEEEMNGPNKKELPFGVFFSHGRYFNGFHCRFKDIARGGLRIVTPPNSDTKALESARQFDEVYGLSYGQQLKNKDIPEGGAKAVVLVDSPNVRKKHHEFLKRKSVRAFVDSILDLTVRDERFERTVVDRYGEDEVIFLGPDEQVIPADIDWIVERAARRGYNIPPAFMSSKKEAGFNHKQYGVTSEGVVVFLDVALKESLGIDPKTQPFTVKVTGGPDGDVAGNLLKILFREYGDNAKVVGISDVDGVAEDPAGLDRHELMRLVEESRSIIHFNPAKLSSEGVLMEAKASEEGLARRNTMPFRVKADAFVPAGGRPNTINSSNWRNFLDENGEPTSRLIVEGANIYNTKDAREELFKHAGVMIVKDSSANKCGVVTSSCEIACSMLLSKEEFIENKEALVKDVLAHLRKIAEAEAKLMFTLYKNFPGNLPHFSERISGCINRVTDALIDELKDKNLGDPLFEELLPLVRKNLPPKLAEIAWDRARERMPVQYLKNSIASSLASMMVYQEGIHLVESQPANKLAERAIMYYRADVKMQDLVVKIEQGTATPDELQLALAYLRQGGARASMGIF